MYQDTILDKKISFSSKLGKYHIRWPADRPLEEDLGYWKVAYLKPRNEKALALECMNMEIGYYLPLYEKRTRRRDNNKPRKSIVPLFTGYLPFVDRDGGKRQICETKRVVTILEINDQKQFTEDLNQIWQAVTSGVPLGEPEPLRTGQKVVVKEGPLQGLVGVITEIYKQRRLILNVDAFRMAVSVELDREDVEPV